MDIESKIIKVLRKLSLDQIYNAGSGHLGMSFGAANIMYAVYKSAIFNPFDSEWINRDRIVLSAGHGSALLYSCLYLFGFLQKDDLYNFRKLGGLSGHPSIKTKGVDCTTGALGQGIANAVGLALAQKYMAAKYNINCNIFNNYTYCICGDGDLMEGVSYEAISFAGSKKLSNLIMLYDSNRVSLDGSIESCFTEDVVKRFEAANWSVMQVNGNNFEEIVQKIAISKQNATPTLIICNTTIGYDTPFSDSNIAHSVAIDKDVYNQIIGNLGVGAEPFFVDAEVLNFCENLVKDKLVKYKEWQKLYNFYALKHPKLNTQIKGDLPTLKSKLTKRKYLEPLSTRRLWGESLNNILVDIPNILVGSADLAGPSFTELKAEGNFGDKVDGRNISYGVREFAMSAIAAGLSLYGGNILPVVSTFLVFSDYMRAGIRMSAIMNRKMIYAFTHDSIMVGEDGITHQPVEHLETLRAMPNLKVFRPCDEVELNAAIYYALNKDAPTALCLTRQKLPVTENSKFDGALCGGYVLSAEQNKKELNAIIIATGSEVELALNVQRVLTEDGYNIRVVSMPNRELFFSQDSKYQESVLPNQMRARVVVEMGATAGWYKVVGLDGAVCGVDQFGQTGNPVELRQKYNFAIQNVVDVVKDVVKKNNTKISSII